LRLPRLPWLEASLHILDTIGQSYLSAMLFPREASRSQTGYEAGLRQFRQHARMVSAPETGADDSETNFVHLHSAVPKTCESIEILCTNPLMVLSTNFRSRLFLMCGIFGLVFSMTVMRLQSFTPASRSSSTEDTTPWVKRPLALLLNGEEGYRKDR